jgi:hypothetical protein
MLSDAGYTGPPRQIFYCKRALDGWKKFGLVVKFFIDCVKFTPLVTPCGFNPLTGLKPLSPRIGGWVFERLRNE